MPIDLSIIQEAVESLMRNAKPKSWSESIELIINLRDFDPKKADRRISEVAELPNETPKPVKVCVIASGDLNLRAQRAGADLVLDKEAVERLGGDKRSAKRLAGDYDFFLSEAPLMSTVGRTLGAYLGPRGKMPTVVPPNADMEAVLARARRSVRIRVKDQPLIKCRVGTMGMDPRKVSENAQAVLARVEARMERGLRNIGGAFLKSTMSPKVKVNLSEAG